MDERYGRVVRGSYVIGSREVKRYRAYGIDLSPFEGIQVVTKPNEAVLTVYRNRDLRRLRRDDHPRRRRWRWR